jgi:hypothetical protein
VIGDDTENANKSAIINSHEGQISKSKRPFFFFDDTQNWGYAKNWGYYKI